jgi:chromosomal replication initiation ATPase DnaA
MKYVKEAVLVKLVSKITAVSVGDLYGISRKAEVSESRQLLWLLMRERGWSCVSIGLEFGRNHSTIVAGIKHVRNLIETEEKLKNIYRQLRQLSDN